MSPSSPLRGLLHSLPHVALLTFAGLSPTAHADSLHLDYTASSASGSGNVTNGSASGSINQISSSLDLTYGNTVSNLDFGSFLAIGSYASGSPNGTTYSLNFTVTRPITFTVNSGPTFTVNELLPVSLFGGRGGSAGQYNYFNATLSSYSANYSLGSYGTLQADFTGGSTNFTGLSSTGPIGVTGSLTLVPIPETSSAFVMSLTALVSLATVLRQRKSARRTR